MNPTLKCTHTESKTKLDSQLSSNDLPIILYSTKSRHISSLINHTFWSTVWILFLCQKNSLQVIFKQNEVGFLCFTTYFCALDIKFCSNLEHSFYNMRNRPQKYKFLSGIDTSVSIQYEISFKNKNCIINNEWWWFMF